MSGMADWVTGCAVTRREAVLTLALGSSAVLAACAAPAASPTSAPAKPPTAPSPAPTPAPTIAAQPAASTAVAKPPPAPSPAPKPTQAPAKQQVVKITVALPSLALVFAPLLIAQGRKLFEEEAIESDLQVFATAALMFASLINGESQFECGGSNEPFLAYEKGVDCVTVAGFPTASTLEFAVRNEFLRDKGATPRQPLKDKVNALKGARIAVPSLAGTPAQYTRYALKTYGLDPEKDVEFTPVPSGPTSVAAIRAGQADAFVGSPPDPEIAESEGFASVFIDLGAEVPALKNIVYEAFFGRRDWIEGNRNVTERVCRAVARGNNLIINNLPAAKEAIKSTLPQMNPQTVDLAMDRIKARFAVDARMTEEMWKNAADVYLFAGIIKSAPSPAEGTLWTNKYLVNVPKG